MDEFFEKLKKDNEKEQQREDESGILLWAIPAIGILVPLLLGFLLLPHN